MIRLAIVGSTGSIGTQVLNVVRHYPNNFKIVSLVANSNIELLKRQADEFNPQMVGIVDEKAYLTAKSLFKNIKLVCGKDALTETVELKNVDTAIVSVVGMLGLKSVIAAINSGKKVALANKEALVSGGEIVMDLAKRKGIEIIPIDSEHSAIWQCLKCGNKNDVSKIVLTASGGAFFKYTADMLREITPEQAVKHPNWNMGKKISVDSATMFNKGLEIIEARWLFDTKNIDYIIHPESIIHSMVEYTDGAVIAQLSNPDMELPIQLALTYPNRMETMLPKLDLTKKPLTFFEPDENRFPAPRLAKHSLELGGLAPVIFNAANEIAVELFLKNKIKFTDIYKLVESTLLKFKNKKNHTLEEIYITDKNIREELMKDYN